MDMPRKNRLFIPGMPHLAQLRGHNGEELFRHEEDYSAFERCMQDAAQRYAVSIHSWSLAVPQCAMPLVTTIVIRHIAASDMLNKTAQRLFIRSADQQQDTWDSK
ncbi:hypothetical protein A3N69_06230 [Klebsiella aerogenes]|nr:hypothetical protein A3N69_06230 [Klebsiella aerogenes]